MSARSKKEYIETIYLRCREASGSQKVLILNEFCPTLGHHRKHVIHSYQEDFIMLKSFLTCPALQSPKVLRCRGIQCQLASGSPNFTFFLTILHVFQHHPSSWA